MKSKGDRKPSADDRGRRFYRIFPARDGLVDIWLTPGTAITLTDDLTGRIDYDFEILAVCGVDPEDPQWNGDLEEHIRRNYESWVKSAEVIRL